MSLSLRWGGGVAWVVALAAIHSVTVDGGWARTRCGPADLVTQWGLLVNASTTPVTEYPRPQLVRTTGWVNLNGLWEFEGAPGNTTPPHGRTLNSSVLVPFPVESCLSGVGTTHKHLLYRRVLPTRPFPAAPGRRTLLHFDAVDWSTDVAVNGIRVGSHIGGYDAFSFDVTSQLTDGPNEATLLMRVPLNSLGFQISLYVFDPSDDGVQPNGKQHIPAITHPSGARYTPSSGIWQTVWLEDVPATHVTSISVSTNMSGASITVHSIPTSGVPVEMNVTLPSSGTPLKVEGRTGQPIEISVPQARLWSPEDPYLYDFAVKLLVGTSEEEDVVQSYMGLRSIRLGTVTLPGTGPQDGVDYPGSDMAGSPFFLPRPDHALCWKRCNDTGGCRAWAYGVPHCDEFAKPQCWLKSAAGGRKTNECRVSGLQGGVIRRPYLNEQPIFFSGWLDQSFWPDGLYTAPTDEALAFDVLAVKRFGLNVVRMHQKVNPERWYYHADRQGVLVLQDAVQKLPTNGQGAKAPTRPFFVNDLQVMVQNKMNHPCIIQWNLFNERDCVNVFNDSELAGLVRMVKEMDPTRLVDTNSGGPANDLHVGDVNDIHDYPQPHDPGASATQYAMVGEFGGMGAYIPHHQWLEGKCHSYMPSKSPADQAQTYIDMLSTIEGFKKTDLSSVIYTQIVDVETECDGLLSYDRTDKFTAADVLRIAAKNKELISAPYA